MKTLQGWSSLLTEWIARWPLHLVFCAMFAAVVVIAPQQAGILVYKGCLILGAPVATYWVFRLLFGVVPSDTPDDVHRQWQVVVMCSAAMIAAALAA